MEAIASTEARTLFVTGVQALLAGRRSQARDLLLEYIAQDEQNDEAWLWVSGCMDEWEDIQVALENCLDCNPHNIRAQQGLAWVQQHRPT